MTLFSGETVQRKIVSMADVVHALAEDLSYGTGLLPQNALWWQNTRGGPVVAIYIEPQIRKLALLVDVTKPPDRYEIPLPGLIFLCTPGMPPWLFAVKKKPTKETDMVFKAPLCNVHDTGMSCGGDHKYPKSGGYGRVLSHLILQRDIGQWGKVEETPSRRDVIMERA
ncbi:hypothetical protein LCGC14_2595320 [marine sediment metagenome]|uniref:Uncharacterized protein n=1 Tax=marine sediment metagenome TaxID=412755 RepID=A0A0F9AAD4_9ZZZZ